MTKPHTVTLEGADIVACFTELGTYERHFNDVQGRYRALASTWLLAAIAAIGFILTNELDLSVDRFLLIAAIAVAAAVGVTLLWYLDLVVYQGLLHAAFVVGLVLEEEHPEIPRMRQLMYAFMKGNAAARVVFFYLGCTGALLLTALIAIAVAAFGDVSTWWAVVIVVTSLLPGAAWLLMMYTRTGDASTLPKQEEPLQKFLDRQLG